MRCSLQAALHVAGLLLFARGFLLTRVELKGESGCGDAAHLTPQRTRAEADGCWADAPVRKAVVLIVDGLRWDIAAAQAQSAVHGRALALPTLSALVRSRGAVLLPFVADPPTTTQQRLKGLLTGALPASPAACCGARARSLGARLALAGGLPTFVDVGDSFGAPALLEDNLVAALRRCGRRVALLGDDTWLQLFPRSAFSVAHPFPSFNVADLHTVDDGVAAQLAPLLAAHAQWDVLVAHFLGVDHAGHTNGVDSAEMAAKLAQMDAQLASVADTLAADASHRDTLLLLLGDHGMTWAGDHGGASDEEIRSALFAMRPSGAAAAARRDWQPPSNTSGVPQLDFAATLALLLGVPVPFGSVGRVSEPLWTAAGGDAASFAAARRANAWQVARALDAYAAAGAFADTDVASLRRLYAETAAADDAAAADAFLAAAAALARAQWTTFGAASMAAGLVVLGSALAGHAYALRAFMPIRAAATDAYAPLAVVAAVISACFLGGSFSVGFMQVEQAASHAPMLAYATACTCFACWRSLREHVGSASLAAAIALLVSSAALAAAAMPGEDKPTGAHAHGMQSPVHMGMGTARALLPLAALPFALLPRGEVRCTWFAATTWACHAAVALHWIAHDLAAAGWSVPPDAAHVARLVLPRFVYSAGAVAAAAGATGLACGAVSNLGTTSQHALAALAAPLVMLTGRRAPLLALLAATQAAALLRCHQQRASPDASSAPAGTSAPPRAAPLTRWGVCSLAAASHFAALQLFAATGHRSGFDSLHFKAAFTVRCWRLLALLVFAVDDAPAKCRVRGSTSSASCARGRCWRPTPGPPSWLRMPRCPRWRTLRRAAAAATPSGALPRWCWRLAGFSMPRPRRPLPLRQLRCGGICTCGRCLRPSLCLRQPDCCWRTCLR